MKDHVMKSEQNMSDALFDLGEAWASYGLKVAELAVATSARTLTNVSKMLGALSTEIKREKPEVIDITP